MTESLDKMTSKLIKFNGWNIHLFNYPHVILSHESHSIEDFYVNTPKDIICTKCKKLISANIIKELLKAKSLAERIK